MSISAQQLASWTRQGAVQTAEATHSAIRNALGRYRGWPPGISYETYLQGSYRNTTNIRGDSDVDVVVECTSTYYPDTHLLAASDKARFEGQRSPADYEWIDFRRDVLRALRATYGNLMVKEGKHSLKLMRTSSHLPADVVPAILYREFTAYEFWSSPAYVDGMTFWAHAEQRQIVNYPKIHYQNGTEKNQYWRTHGNYKSVVRMFKNARTYLVDRGRLGANVAPSYFLECLLYNVPDNRFTGGDQQAFLSVLAWLADSDLSDLRCQNERLWLFGRSPQQWTKAQARQTVNAITKLWNEDSL